MRYSKDRMLSIVRNSYHLDSMNGDVFIFMSKNRRTVRMIHFENNAYYLHQKTFVKGYRFMKVTFKEEKPVYSIDWKDLMAVLESPVINCLSIGSGE